MSHASSPVPAVRRRLRRHRRGVAVAGLLVVLALVGAACKQLDPDNRAAKVPGVTNGNLPMSYLASTTKGCIVYDEAIGSLNAMIAQAAKDGITLRPTSCYRDYAGQVAVRETWCGRGACHMAAVPGTSNHGWGKAVDFADGSGTLEFDSEGYAWLKTWAGHFGWHHPGVMEPGGPVPEAWHWEWVGDGGKMYLGEYFGIGNSPMSVPRGLPYGSVDVLKGIPGGGIKVQGWAIDPDQVASIPVHAYVGSAGHALMANKSRPDVAKAFPLYAGAPHGFSDTLPAAPGTHRVCLYALNMSGTGYNRTLTCATVTVPEAPAPAGPAATPPTTVAPPSTTTTSPAPPTSVAPSTTTSTTTAPSTTSTTTPGADAGAEGS